MSCGNEPAGSDSAYSPSVGTFPISRPVPQPVISRSPIRSPRRRGLTCPLTLPASAAPQFFSGRQRGELISLRPQEQQLEQLSPYADRATRVGRVDGRR